MNVYVNIKAAGKRKPVLEREPYEIQNQITNLGDLLSAFVETEVDRYNQKGTDIQLIPYLTDEEICNQVSGGKVGFGRIYSEKRADKNKALKNAIQCYTDGLVRVFWNDTELTDLEEPIQIADGDCFTFIRLTFLAGRLW